MYLFHNFSMTLHENLSQYRTYIGPYGVCLFWQSVEFLAIFEHKNILTFLQQILSELYYEKLRNVLVLEALDQVLEFEMEC